MKRQAGKASGAMSIVISYLQEGKDISEVSNRLPAFAKKFLGDNVNKTEYLVQPLSELHFDDRFGTYTYNTTSRGMLISLEVSCTDIGAYGLYKFY